MEKSFLKYYDAIKEEFGDNSELTVITPSQEAINWPNSSGVYVIWDKNGNLIYVGMTGKFSKDETGTLYFNNATFQSRASRFTPYRFCESIRDKKLRYYFKFGPKKSGDEQGRIKYESDSYEVSIPYQDIEIHCFHINEDHPYLTPVLLESDILTKCLKLNGHLPPANNSL